MIECKVEGYPDLVKRGPSVITVNRTEYERALLRKKKASKDKMVEKRLDAMETTLSEILRMMKNGN